MKSGLSVPLRVKSGVGFPCRRNSDEDLEALAEVARTDEEEARLRQLGGGGNPLLVVVGPAVVVAPYTNTTYIYV